MKKILVCIVSLLISAQGLAAAKIKDLRFDDSPDWNHFDNFMQAAEMRDREIGWSYLISGVLVGIGGTLGSQASEDAGSKVIYGLSASIGVGAAGYGAIRLINGNNYSSFYDSLKQTALTPAQRDQLVKFYIESERHKEEVVRWTRIISHVVIGGMNLYSADHEKDKNAKTLFQFLAGVNFAMAIAYTF